MEGLSKKLASRESELSFLCTHVRELETEYQDKNKEFDADVANTIRKRVLHEYAEYDPSIILARGFLLREHDHKRELAALTLSHDREHDVRLLLERVGIRNTLALLEDFNKVHPDKRVRERLFAVVISAFDCNS